MILANSPNDILITSGSVGQSRVDYIPKDGLKIVSFPDKGKLYLQSKHDDKAAIGKSSVEISYIDVTSPITADIDELASLISTWKGVSIATDTEVLVTAQDLTGAYADFGGEIDAKGYTEMSVDIVVDANDSQDVDLKIVKLNESGGTEYDLAADGTVRIWSGAGTDINISYTFNINDAIYVKIKAKAGTVGATAGDLTININKV